MYQIQSCQTPNSRWEHQKKNCPPSRMEFQTASRCLAFQKANRWEFRMAIHSNRQSPQMVIPSIRPTCRMFQSQSYRNHCCRIRCQCPFRLPFQCWNHSFLHRLRRFRIRYPMHHLPNRQHRKYRQRNCRLPTNRPHSIHRTYPETTQLLRSRYNRPERLRSSAGIGSWMFEWSVKVRSEGEEAEKNGPPH